MPTLGRRDVTYYQPGEVLPSDHLLGDLCAGQQPEWYYMPDTVRADGSRATLSYAYTDAGGFSRRLP